MAKRHVPSAWGGDNNGHKLLFANSGRVVAPSFGTLQVTPYGVTGVGTNAAPVLGVGIAIGIGIVTRAVALDSDTDIDSDSDPDPRLSEKGALHLHRRLEPARRGGVGLRRGADHADVPRRERRSRVSHRGARHRECEVTGRRRSSDDTAQSLPAGHRGVDLVGPPLNIALAITNMAGVLGGLCAGGSLIRGAYGALRDAAPSAVGQDVGLMRRGA
jgi:hypothetical protein